MEIKKQFPVPEISGEDYDYSVTMKPERPYIHDYSKTLVTKLDIGFKAGPGKCRVTNTFEQALEKIKAVDKITLGVPKIMYLVGFQYHGHDSGYPAWHKVNEAAKHECDPDAKTSLLWLMEEAYKYNTTVSFHINMNDAYEHSVLWDTYIENDLFCTDEQGNILKSGIWDGDQCYEVCHKKEWESGFAKKRIDELLEMYPIQKAGTIHIDAFHNNCIRNGCKCGGFEQSIKARRQIIRYFRDKGVDVTSEHIYCDPPEVNGEELFIGLQPMSWLFSQKLEDYIKRPANLLCGGVCTEHFQGKHTIKYKTLFGENCSWFEGIMDQDVYKGDILQSFCLTYLPFHFLNSRDRISATAHKDGNITAQFSDGVVTQLNDELITRNGVVMRRNDDLCLPAEWLEEKNLVMYSKNAGTKSWQVSDWFGDVSKLFVRALTEEGLSEEVCEVPVENGFVTIDFAAGGAFVCTQTDKKVF